MKLLPLIESQEANINKMLQKYVGKHFKGRLYPHRVKSIVYINYESYHNWKDTVSGCVVIHVADAKDMWIDGYGTFQNIESFAHQLCIMFSCKAIVWYKDISYKIGGFIGRTEIFPDGTKMSV